MEAAGVGEEGVGPGGEAVEAAEFFDDVGAGSEPEVVGVAEDNFGVQVIC